MENVGNIVQQKSSCFLLIFDVFFAKNALKLLYHMRTRKSKLSSGRIWQGILSFTQNAVFGEYSVLLQLELIWI